MVASDQVHVVLDRTVALVLFDFLARVADEENGERLAEAIEHASELPTLWATLASLESVLEEPFAPNYAAILEKARKSVIKRLGGAMP